MKQAWTFFWVMAGFFLVFQVIAYAGESQGNPLLTAIGLNPAQGNLEGHEFRFGQGLTSLFVTATTAFATGTIDTMHDSLTPLASITPLSQMLLNMVFGGKEGVGCRPGDLRHPGCLSDRLDGRPHARSFWARRSRPTKSSWRRCVVPDAPDVAAVLQRGRHRLQSRI